MKNVEKSLNALYKEEIKGVTNKIEFWQLQLNAIQTQLSNQIYHPLLLKKGTKAIAELKLWLRIQEDALRKKVRV